MNIGIVGLGLIGGSLGLDFRALGHQVLGVSRRHTTCEVALERGVVDQASPDLGPACQGKCDLSMHAARGASDHSGTTDSAPASHHHSHRCGVRQSCGRAGDRPAVAPIHWGTSHGGQRSHGHRCGPAPFICPQALRAHPHRHHTESCDGHGHGAGDLPRG